MNEEIRYKLLKLLEQNPEISQRELAKKLGISVGKTNYCVKALKERGLVKARNFRNNPDKRRYLYILTPQGVEEKAKVATRFLRKKMDEFESLRKEIEELKREQSRIDRGK